MLLIPGRLCDPTPALMAPQGPGESLPVWQKYGVHHPFLLKSYPFNKTTGGVPYHRKVAWMNLTPDHAKHISFIELLPVPTTGNTQEQRFWKLFDGDHAARIDRLIGTGTPRVVVLSKTLLTNYMLPAKRTRGVFARVARRIPSWRDEENRGHDYIRSTALLIDDQQAKIHGLGRLPT